MAIHSIEQQILAPIDNTKRILQRNNPYFQLPSTDITLDNPEHIALSPQSVGDKNQEPTDANSIKSLRSYQDNLLETSPLKTSSLVTTFAMAQKNYQNTDTLKKSQAITTPKTAVEKTLTPTQEQALKQLHTVAVQLQGLFMGMMMSAMRSTVPSDPLLGDSQAENIFTDMLDQQRSQEMSESGSVTIAPVIERQLRQSVLDNAAHDSRVQIPIPGMM